MSNKACEGADTDPVRTTEHMEKCRACGMMVRDDLTEHPFFGFKAGCEAKAMSAILDKQHARVSGQNRGESR